MIGHPAVGMHPRRQLIKCFGNHRVQQVAIGI
jgi:hypothetical protein